MSLSNDKWTTLASGTLSGVFTCLLLQPIDLLKTRLQQGGISIQQPPSLKVTDKVRNFNSNSRLISAISSIYTTKGLVGFWQGLAPTLYRNVPGLSLYFLTYEQLKKLTIRTHLNSQPKLTPRQSLLVGSSSRAIVTVMVMPMTVIKTRVESSLYPNLNTTLQAFQSLWKENRFKALYRGTTVTVLRDAPYAGIYLYCYNHIQLFTQTHQSHIATDFVYGVGAGFLANLITQPFDVLKTRIQLIPKSKGSPLSLALKQLVLEPNFLRNIYSGLLLRATRKSLSSALAWTGYEGLKRWEQTRNPLRS